MRDDLNFLECKVSVSTSCHSPLALEKVCERSLALKVNASSVQVVNLNVALSVCRKTTSDVVRTKIIDTDTSHHLSIFGNVNRVVLDSGVNTTFSRERVERSSLHLDLKESSWDSVGLPSASDTVSSNKVSLELDEGSVSEGLLHVNRAVFLEFSSELVFQALVVSFGDDLATLLDL